MKWVDIWRKQHVAKGHRVLIYDGRSFLVECETCMHAIGLKTREEKKGKQHKYPIAEITEMGFQAVRRAGLALMTAEQP